MIRQRERLGRIDLAVTDRRAGVSEAPYDSANLGRSVGDDDDAVRVNRGALAAELGVESGHLVVARQVHGAAVAQIASPWPAPGWTSNPAKVDVLVTATAGLALVALVADCVPVLLADDRAGVVAVAHAGRLGLVAGVVDAAVDACRGMGARDLQARVGPSVCGLCYEVPAAMQRDVVAVVPASRSTTREGTPALDLAAGVLAQLHAAGVAASRWAGCTREDPTLYSHRRDGITGRFAGVAVLRE